MRPFGELLLEARQHARFTQKALAEKVDLDDSYISRLERGVYRPPPRDVVLKFVDALGISDDEEKYLQFLAVAGVLSDEDLENLKEFALVKVADRQAVKLAVASGIPLQDIYGRRMPPETKDKAGEAEEEEEQASSQPPPSIVRNAKPIPDTLFGTSREEFYNFIASAHLTDEDEEKVFAAFVEIAKPILALIQPQYEKGKER